MSVLWKHHVWTDSSLFPLQIQLLHVALGAWSEGSAIETNRSRTKHVFRACALKTCFVLVHLIVCVMYITYLFRLELKLDETFLADESLAATVWCF